MSLCLGTLLPVKVNRDPGIPYKKNGNIPSSDWVLPSQIMKCQAPASHGLVHDFHGAQTWAKVRIPKVFQLESLGRSFHPDTSCTLFSYLIYIIYDVEFFLIWENHYEHLWTMSPFSSSFRTCWPSWFLFLCCLGCDMAPTSGQATSTILPLRNGTFQGLRHRLASRCSQCKG